MYNGVKEVTTTISVHSEAHSIATSAAFSGNAFLNKTFQKKYRFEQK